MQIDYGVLHIIYRSPWTEIDTRSLQYRSWCTLATPSLNAQNARWFGAVTDNDENSGNRVQG